MSETDAKAEALELARMKRLYRQYKSLQYQAKQIEARLNELKPQLLAYAEAHGEEAANGHRDVELDESDYFVDPSGKTHTGWRREIRVSRTINEERARELAERKGIVADLFEKQVVEVLVQENLYRFQQEGLLTNEELDSLIDVTTTPALKGL
ncbi:hypothetical protein [Microbispora sp. NPDC049633]|uniref:hypothetical protein n=1 Tax=Microbispora sp. NPDC049633 TaxID=3154355 RepID=UPI0034200C50